MAKPKVLKTKKFFNPMEGDYNGYTPKIEKANCLLADLCPKQNIVQTHAVEVMVRDFYTREDGREDVIIAALLYAARKDGKLSNKKVREEFNKPVENLVEEVSEFLLLKKSGRSKKLLDRLSEKALLIVVAEGIYEMIKYEIDLEGETNLEVVMAKSFATRRKYFKRLREAFKNFPSEISRFIDSAYYQYQKSV